MKFSPLLEQLIAALRYLPGVGPKTAQRMAFQLLERGRENGQQLALILQTAMQNIHHCQRCRTFTESEVCQLCASSQRDQSVLCIVENPIDMAAIEHTAQYRGLYFVLMGRLSPLDGLGPDNLGMPQLMQRLSEKKIYEVIIATNPTVEGEATAHYISALVKQYAIKVTRIAHGVPLGGELEYVDSGTLAHALAGRDTL